MAAPFPALPDPDDVWPAPPVDAAAEQATLGLRAGDTASFDAMDLAQHLADDDKRWKISDADQAEWAMAKLAQATANLDALDRQLGEYVHRIQTWHRNARAEPGRDHLYFTALLMLYGWKVRAETGDKTVRLPSGQIATRKASDAKAYIADDPAVVQWAQANHPEIVETTHRVTVTALREVVTVDGDRVLAPNADGELEPVPGTYVEAGAPVATPKPYETS